MLLNFSSKVFVILTLSIASANRGVAQSEDSTRQIVEDGYIEKMYDKINLKLALTNNIETFSVHANTDIELYPNTSTLARLFFNYRIISFSLSFVPKFMPGNDDDSIRGKTTGGGFGLGLTFNKWSTELNYNKAKGYYLYNTNEHDPSWSPGDPYIQFPQLVSKIFGGMTSYSFNSRFSQTAVTTQTTRQLKSAGTFIPRLMYRYYIVDEQSGRPNSQKSNNFQTMLGLSYWHTFVYKGSFYFSIGLTPAAGLVYTKFFTRYSTGTIITKEHGPVYMLDGQSGLGYNGRRFFAGIYARATSITNKQQNTTAINDEVTTAYQAFIGYRFGAPRFLRNSYDAVFRKFK